MVYFIFSEMPTNQNREAIIALHRKGKTQKEIISALKVPQSTVSRAIKRFKELGTSEDRPRSGRPVTATTPKMVKRIRERIRRNPNRSMRKMAKQLKISEWSVRQIVHKRLRMRSYAFAAGHDLSDPKKRQVRVDLCRKLLKERNCGTILFSDEKIFTVLPPRNRRNSRIIGRSRLGKCRIFSSI
jgi:inhibitor of nuclear factor kappa-B kinase subunit alpha